MKRIISIFSVMFLAFTACTYEIEQPSSVSYPEGMVKVRVQAIFPDVSLDTRAMGNVPSISKLYIAVFGSEGSFQSWIPAEFEQISSYVDHSSTATYSVLLPITDKKRHLHFVANPPLDEEGNVILPVFGDEDEVINAMIKHKGSSPEPEDAYWQKVEMDHIGAQGSTADDHGFYTPDDYTQGQLATICLVRNFAKIKVAVPSSLYNTTEYPDGPPYEVLEYRLMNVPNTGSVAPWNTGARQYEPNYMNILSFANDTEAAPGTFYEALMRTYLGYMPDATDIDTVMPSSSVPVSDNDSDGAFMYERTMFTRASEEGTQTCFIVKVKFNQATEVGDNITIPANTSRFYKIAILGPDGEYIPILRNIQYSIEVYGIDEYGYDTAQDAADGDFSGNISTGLAISSLNELSNGSSTIRVNQTEFTSNGQVDPIIGKVPDYTIYWQFFPTSGTAAGTPVTSVGEGTVNGEVYDVTLAMYDITPESAVACSLEELLANGLGTADLSSGTWGTITVPIAERGVSVKTSVIRVSARYGTGRRLFREVIINVIPQQKFLNPQPQTTDASIKGTYIEADELDENGKKVQVHFRLPEGLGASLFPLNIMIEAKNNNLYSTSQDLPVSTGASYWNEDQNTFYFIRQVTLDEYRTIQSGAYVYKQDYVCTLYTSLESGNSTDVVLQDEQGFFKPCELKLTATATLYADKYEQEVGYSATSATVNVTSSMNWTITNLSAGLTASPSSFTAGSSMQTTAVEFYFDPNETTLQKEYEADIVGTVNGKSITKPIKIIQKKYVEPVNFSVSDFSSLSTTYYNYGSTTTATVTRDDVSVRLTNSYRSGSNYVVSGYRMQGYTRQGTIEVTPPEGKAVKDIIVTYYSNPNYTQNPSASTGSYTVSTASGVTTGRWIGTSSSAVTLTMGYRTSGGGGGGSYTFPYITSISVIVE